MISKLLFPHRCYHGGTMHRFEPRFTVIGGAGKIDTDALFFADSEHKAEVARAMIGGKQLYRGDVCVWCGKVSNEQGTPS